MSFLAVYQAAWLTRCIDRDGRQARGVETEWLLTSRSAKTFDVAAILAADRRCWSMETSPQLRLEVTAGDDRGRVRHPTRILNLAMIRRALVSVAVYCIQ